MSGHFGGLLNKTFVAVLVVLGVIGLSLFAIFNFVAVSQLSVEMGLLFFALASILLILGYMFGIMVVGFLAIFVLTRLWQRKRENPASTK
jgi:hypothetical protein